MKKVAVLFHYYNNNQTYRDNLIHFIACGWCENCDFYIVDADNAEIPVMPQIGNISWLKTKNENLDYGGYSQALKIIGTKISEYDSVIFINSSVRGPFTSSANGLWYEEFEKLLEHPVHLVSSSINILEPSSHDSLMFQEIYGGQPPYIHAQTTAYALSKPFLKQLCNDGFYEITAELEKSQLIYMYEIGLSQRAFEFGYNINCLLEKYRGLDYRRLKTDINPTSRDGDPLRRKAYFGRTPSPKELMFIKTNRRLMSRLRLDLETYRSLRKVKQPQLNTWSEFKMLKKTIHKRILRSVFASASVAAAVTYSILALV